MLLFGAFKERALFRLILAAGKVGGDQRTRDIVPEGSDSAGERGDWARGKVKTSKCHT